jgi:transcription-repair coupling factor (superfamily II helicase)
VTQIERIARAPGALEVGGAPEGVDAMAFCAAAQMRGGVSVFVARDDARAAGFAAACAFFAPDLELLRLPAWDCLPYDRVSPSPEVAARRAATLSALARRSDSDGPAAVVTTVSALGQRTPPRAVMAAASFATSKGARLDQKDLLSFLEANGYSRAGAVMERGDYAVRGGVVDLFPPGAAAPVRIDLFGDEVDALRTFDPETQRSEAALDRLELSPASEALLTSETIANFRRNYLAALGRGLDDVVYEAVSAGSRIQGMEHWLPLFYEQVETPFEYFGVNALITLDYQADEAWGDRLALIRDYHDARTQSVTQATGALAAPSYRALPPNALYLDEKSWKAGLDAAALRRFGPFAADGPDAVDLGGRQGRNFAAERAQEGVNVFDAVAAHIEALRRSGRRVLLAAWSEGAADRMADVLGQHGLTKLRPVESWSEIPEGKAEGVFAAVLPLEHGFETADMVALSEQDILGDRLIRSARRKRAKNFIAEVSALSPGDLVVHVDHGISRYVGLKTLDVMGAPHDCLELEYSGGDKLFLPVENVELLSRYGADSGDASLDRLGGAAWQARKARAKQRLRDMAEQLIRIAAQRAMKEAEPVNPPAGVYDEFAARFPYSETEDQLAAIEDVFTDLAAGRPMDRLICGDVGFGKTEVALRAAFVVAMTGRQVAVVAPTTLLARQHYNTFAERFRGWPVKVRPLSRLVAAKDAAMTREMLKSGQCDIVVGTHALLSKQVSFKDLGLIVIDEEQRFGVKHKERLKEMRTDTHVLTLSATPIPRTLQQALTGIRELSIISTPPVDRLAVRTYIAPFDPVTIREALLREKYRGGQSFFVAPKIANLPELEEFLRTQVPEVSVIVAHGQMAATQLEDAMTAFYEGRYDVLLSTTIVESGLDIPTANTLVIHRADMFGLAQLYQLRGRVGRSKQRAYAYLTTPSGQTLTGGAERRLKVLHSLDSLGAGFMLASHDLDLRGGGNLLGEEQSGHIRDVGVELYQQMLEEAVASLRAEPQAASNQDWSPAINAGAAVLIPEDYVPDLDLRLQLYRRLSRVEDEQERRAFAAELIDRFGPLPDEVKSLLQVVGVKALCKLLGVEKLDAGPKGAVLAFRDGSAPDPGVIVGLIQKSQNWKMRPDSKLVVRGEWDTPHERLAGAERVLKELAHAAGRSA